MGDFFLGFVVAAAMGGLWIIVEGCREAERMKQRRKDELHSREAAL